MDIRIRTVRLELKLLSVFPELRAHSQRRNILLLIFEKDIGTVHLKVCDHYSNSMHFLWAVKLVCREMFNVTFRFSG